MQSELQRLWIEISGRFIALAGRLRWRYLIAGAAAVLLWLTLDFLPTFFFDTKAFQAKLDGYLDNSGLAVSYQGVDVSLFRGVRIIGVRVSFDRDFSRGRYLLEAPAVYIHTPLSFPRANDRDWLQKSRIIIDGGKIGYWITADNADRELRNQARRLLQQKLQYHIECDNCQFFLNVKDNSYFQEVTPVQTVFFTLRHSGSEIQSLVRYESSTIGNGDFFGKFNACDSIQCDDLEGYWYFKPSRLKIAALNNFQKDFEIASGLVSGEVAFDRKIEESVKTVYGKSVKVREPVSNFRMAMAARDFTITKKKAEWYHSDAFAIDTKMLIRGMSSTGFVRASLEHYDVHADFADLRPDALPEKYLFRIEPKLFSKKILFLPSQKKLTGLENFSINLSGRSGNKYAKTEMSMEILHGAFAPGDESKVPAIQIPEARMSLNNEKFSGNLRAAAGNSSLAAAMEGYLELYPVLFTPKSNALIRESGDNQERKIFALRGKIVSPLIAENIAWTDLKPYMNYWLDDYWDEVRAGIQYSWLPSHLRRREYFVRFIEYLDFSMPIEVKNTDLGKQTSLRGNLFFAPQFSGGGFRLDSADGKNSTSLTVSYGGNEPNAPYMTHELKLNLENGYDLLKPWFGSEYFEYFSGAEIVHTNHFNGERPADHYLKSLSVTDIRLKRVRLGSWARAQNLPLQWETVDLRTNRQNGFGAISSVRAENDNTILSGFGEYKLFDRQIDTSLKYSMITK